MPAIKIRMVSERPRRGRPPRNADQRTARRQDLLDGVMAAIRQGGARLSLDDIAEQVGVSKPVLYSEFGNRIGMADAVAVEMAERVEQQLLTQIPSGVPLNAQILTTAVIASLVDVVEAEPELYKFVVHTMRSDNRPMLANALVNAVHIHARPLISSVLPNIPDSILKLMTDGVYGYVLASLESWQADRTLDRDQLVELLSMVIANGLQSIEASHTLAAPSPEPPIHQ